MTLSRALSPVIALVLLASGMARAQDTEKMDVLDGAQWRNLVLEEIIPLWYQHVRDPEHGAVYMNLSRDWQPQPPWDKVPAMISRQVFSFSAAYLLSGEERYLEVAREGTEYLLQHAWDEEFGGWFDSLTQTGRPSDSTKNVPLQLYTNVGLTLYYFTTGDERVLEKVMKSVEIRRTRGHDEVYDGYYQAFDRQLRVVDDGKKKHGHFGYVGSLLLNLYLATRDQTVLDFETHVMDLTLERMTDPDRGWVYGAGSVFDRQWQRTPWRIDGVEMVHVGGELTASLAYLRLFQQTGDEKYRQAGEALASLTTALSWNADSGAWLHPLPMPPGETNPPGEAPKVHWWIQIYGSLMQLHLYRLTGDPAHLERFAKSESFYLDHFLDRKYGGVFATVTPDGEVVGAGEKASVWHTSYHDLEHGLLNYLYLSTYVNDRPAVLHFLLDGGESGGRHFVSLVDDPGVVVKGVRIDGKPWDAFDAQRREVSLPPGHGLHVEVTLGRSP